MTEYLLRLFLLLPLVGGMAFGALWLWKRVQPGLIGGGGRVRLVRVVDAVPMGATGRLAVVEFADKRLLLAVSRGRIDLLSETTVEGDFIVDAPAGDAPAPGFAERFGLLKG